MIIIIITILLQKDETHKMACKGKQKKLRRPTSLQQPSAQREERRTALSNRCCSISSFWEEGNPISMETEQNPSSYYVSVKTWKILLKRNTSTVIPATNSIDPNWNWSNIKKRNEVKRGTDLRNGECWDWGVVVIVTATKGKWRSIHRARNHLHCSASNPLPFFLFFYTLSFILQNK